MPTDGILRKGILVINCLNKNVEKYSLLKIYFIHKINCLKKVTEPDPF